MNNYKQEMVSCFHPHINDVIQLGLLIKQLSRRIFTVCIFLSRIFLFLTPEIYLRFFNELETPSSLLRRLRLEVFYGNCVN